MPVGRFAWYEPTAAIKAEKFNVGYYAGGYLGTMLNFLSIQMAIPFLMLVNFSTTVSDATKIFGVEMKTLTWILISVLVIVLSLHLRQVYRRKRVIEDGLLSIQASCILWQAVVIAHFRALRDISKTDKSTPDIQYYDGYTKALMGHAKSLRKNYMDIQSWMEKGECQQSDGV